MFEVEYLYNGWVKKDDTIGLTFDIPIDFAFSPRLS